MAIATTAERDLLTRAPSRRLSARDQEVLALSATGHTPETVAEMLQLTTETVRDSLASIIRRVGARSKMEAVMIVVRDGLIDLPVRGVPVLR